MAEKVNKSYTSFHYQSLINLCVFYLSCHLGQRRAETLQLITPTKRSGAQLLVETENR